VETRLAMATRRLAIALVLLCPALARAQLQDNGMHIKQATSPTPDKVQVIVAVDAPHDAAIGKTPAAANFTVWLNQGAATGMTVSRNSGRRQATVILYDESGSYRNKLAPAIGDQVIAAMVNAAPGDRFGLLLFGATTQRLAMRKPGDLLTDLRASKGRPVQTRTNLIAGLSDAIVWAAAEGDPGQREVVMFSDSGDEVPISEIDWQRVAAEARENLVRISVITTTRIVPDKVPSGVWDGIKNKLRALAADTGGVYDDSEQVAAESTLIQNHRAAAKGWLVFDAALCGMKPGAGADVRVEYTQAGQRKAWTGAAELDAGAWAPQTQVACPSQCPKGCAAWEECVGGTCAGMACGTCPGGAQCVKGHCEKACTGCQAWEDCAGGACVARTCVANENCGGGATCKQGKCTPPSKSFLDKYLIFLLAGGGALLLLIAALVLLRKKPQPMPVLEAASSAPPPPEPEPEPRPALGSGPVLDALPETHLEAVAGWVAPGERWRLFKPKMQVGGSKDPADRNDIVFDIKQVSSKHALFELYPSGDIWVRDLGARNGTFVNGRQLAAQERCKLKPGDQVKLSQHLMLRIVRPGAGVLPEVRDEEGLSGAGPGGPQQKPEPPPPGNDKKKKTVFDPGNR